MNYKQQQEDNDAWFARADRFDGFDRGDLDNDYEEERQAMNERNEAEYAALTEWEDDLMHRIKRIESRLVQLMLYMNCDPTKRYELEDTK